MSRIRVTIDRIALRGMDAGEGRALVEGLQGELSRILADAAGTSGARSRRTPVLSSRTYRGRRFPSTFEPAPTGPDLTAMVPAAIPPHPPRHSPAAAR